ncbi:DUF4012 domain-containing protein, partial [Candidatus Gottesmanbacteria bacterium]|nr:DUF4012 domain-containing protein [Candidatus Gottesmanbacteria bacterium]
YQIARETYQAVKNQDINQAETKLKLTHEKLLATQKSYRALAWTRFIPFLGGYWRDGDHLIRAGLAGIEAGEIAIEAIKPYTDLLGLKGQSTFVSKSTDERIQTAVATMDKITPKLGEISQKLEIVKKEVEDINPDRYPAKFAKFAPQSQIAKFKTMTDEVTTLFISAKPLLEMAPTLLGEKEPKRYLVLFQNDKELRSTGGFITAYAIFKFDKGKMTVERSDDIYKLDEAKTKRFNAPPEILKYHKNVYYWQLRDTNISPDFVASMKNFEELYKSVSGKVEYDGIVTVDTHVLVEAMKILGSIPAYGTNFTVDPDKRCNGCPQVIYELEAYADRPVAYEKGSRKDIIGVLLYQIMQKALGVSPGQYWGQLFQMAIQEIAEKHILVYMHEDQAQNGVEAFDMGGRIKDYEADFLHINDTNFAGAKSNMFVEHFVKQEINVENDGSVTKTIAIDYKNPAPPSDCGLESGGLCLNGLLRNWLRVYVPKGSQLLEFKGSEMEVTTYEDLGKTVFGGFLVVRPLGTAQVVVKYKLPFKVGREKGYSLLIQKQPGTEGHEYTVIINGKQIDKFPLKTDKEFKIKL